MFKRQENLADIARNESQWGKVMDAIVAKESRTQNLHER